MTLRLNKSHKEEIARKAKALSPLNKDLKEFIILKDAIAKRIHIMSLGGEDKAKEYKAIADQIQKLKDSIPEELVGYGQVIHMNNGMWVKYTDAYRTYLSLPSSSVVSNDTYTIPKDSAEEIELIAVEKLISDTCQKLKDLESNVYASISSITTVKKLLEQWEEAIELLPEELKQPKIQLPALQTNKLNKLIGLPTKKESK